MPDGLLLHESLIISFLPIHSGMRQYWRDFVSLDVWARSLPHQSWWQSFLRDSGGTFFGTKLTSCAAGWRRRFTTTFLSLCVSCGSRQLGRPEAQCSAPGREPALPVNHRSSRALPKRISSGH